MNSRAPVNQALIFGLDVQTQLRVAFIKSDTKTLAARRILALPSHSPMVRVRSNRGILAKRLVSFSIAVYNVVY